MYGGMLCFCFNDYVFFGNVYCEIETLHPSVVFVAHFFLVIALLHNMQDLNASLKKIRLVEFNQSTQECITNIMTNFSNGVCALCTVSGVLFSSHI